MAEMNKLISNIRCSGHSERHRFLRPISVKSLVVRNVGSGDVCGDRGVGKGGGRLWYGGLWWQGEKKLSIDACVCGQVFLTVSYKFLPFLSWWYFTSVCVCLYLVCLSVWMSVFLSVSVCLHATVRTSRRQKLHTFNSSHVVNVSKVLLAWIKQSMDQEVGCHPLFIHVPYRVLSLLHTYISDIQTNTRWQIYANRYTDRQ